MSNYITGLKKKQLILQTAKELFYDSGYKSVTMRAISKKIGGNQGLINYHFESKSNIATLIYEECVHTYLMLMLPFLYNVESHVVRNCLQTWAYHSMILNNQNMLRFYLEAIKDGMLSYKPLHSLFTNMNIKEDIGHDKQTLEAILILTSGAEYQLIDAYYNNKLSATIDTIHKYNFETMGYWFKYGALQIEEAYKILDTFKQKIEISVESKFRIQLKHK